MYKGSESYRRAGRICIVICAMLPGSPAPGRETSRAAAARDNNRSRLAFRADENGGYTFDTGVLRGVLCRGGEPQGLSAVVHVPTGARVDRGMGILGYYRVFTTNKRYGTAAWDWPGTATALPDGAVQITWPEAAGRPFEMAARYRWQDPQTLDVETTVTARKDLSNFEAFLASYFEAAFAAPFVYVSDSPEAQGKPGLLPAKKSYGDWQMFPRDMQLIPVIRDGRWQIDPNPVDWAIMPSLAAPLALRRSAGSDLAVILMAPPDDCFAMATPCEGETHYSLYLSLFGRDLKPGETAKARTRFTVAPTPSNEQLLALYDQYMKDLLKPGKPPQ